MGVNDINCAESAEFDRKPGLGLSNFLSGLPWTSTEYKLFNHRISAMIIRRSS